MPLGTKFKRAGKRKRPTEKNDNESSPVIKKAQKTWPLFQFTVWSSVPFYQQITTITEGPHAGSYALILTSARSFPFLKLPPEIRNHIYTHVFAPLDESFEKTDENDFRRLYYRRRPIKLEWKQDTRRKTPVWKLCREKAGFNPFSPHWEDIAPSFLRVCRQIAAEALPVLYGTNSFRFDDMDVLLKFFKKIGMHMTLIKEIEVFHYKVAPDAFLPFEDIFCELGFCESLKHLKIYYHYKGNRDHGEAVVAFFVDSLPWVHRPDTLVWIGPGAATFESKVSLMANESSFKGSLEWSTAQWKQFRADAESLLWGLSHPAAT